MTILGAGFFGRRRQTRPPASGAPVAVDAEARADPRPGSGGRGAGFPGQRQVLVVAGSPACRRHSGTESHAWRALLAMVIGSWGWTVRASVLVCVASLVLLAIIVVVLHGVAESVGMLGGSAAAWLLLSARRRSGNRGE